ncbi:hypothetical protein PWT90_00624 [Aphanocladium album]|nr:hypothetical protein PWT90_00624 [Aphanocladium album]
MPSTKFSIDSLPSLTGKVYVVTGGNAGMCVCIPTSSSNEHGQRKPNLSASGYSTVEGLASRGAKVYVGARSESKARDAIQTIKTKLPDADLHFLPFNLASLASVVAAARMLRGAETALHGLINNAGIMGVPFAMTEDGYEVQFQTNYISHWLLTYHLLPLLQATSGARLVNVTSDGHERFVPAGGIKFDDLSLESQNTMMRYGQSKLANVLHAKELHRRYGPSAAASAAGNGGIRTAAVHPGHINTNLNKQATGAAPGLVLRAVTPIMRCICILDEQDKGALSSLFAIASDEFKAPDSGAYVIPYATIGTPSKYAQDGELAKKLFDWTESQLSAKGLLSLE